MKLFGYLGLLTRSGRRFSADRKGGPAVEFALVGLAYFTLLFIVIQSGIYYLQFTVVDYATEAAGRTMLINGNAGSSVVAPVNAAALQADIAGAGFGLLNQSNVNVSVKMCAPVGQTTVTSGASGFCTGGFGATAMSTSNFDTTNGTFQYVPGVCTGVSYVIGNPGGAYQQIGQVNASSCTQNCNVANNDIVNGEIEGGTTTYSTSGGTTFENVSGAKFVCSAEQDIVMQVQYTGYYFVNFISYLFGPINSTLTFQTEPSTT